MKLVDSKATDQRNIKKEIRQIMEGKQTVAYNVICIISIHEIKMQHDMDNCY